MTIAAVDLGATSVRVAYLGPEGVTVVRSPDGADAIPATVWLADRGTARVGALGADAPADEVISTVRADLGTDLRDTQQRYFHGRFESPESVAGYLLTDAARRVSTAASTTVKKMLLGVPVPTADGAALRRAAVAARLTVVGTIAEPVAVALHYGVVADGADQVAVVHDLGGTTLDLTVLRISGRNVAILRSARYPIGGKQWDEALAGELLTEAHMASTVPERASLACAERLRTQLSQPGADQVSGWLTGPSGEGEVHLDRTRLEAITAHLLHQIVDLTRQIIEDAAASGAIADTILLAGGASQMPMVAEALASGLGLAVRVSQPQLAVVRGLALTQDFGLLFVTGQDGAPLDLPPAALPPSAGQERWSRDDKQPVTVLDDQPAQAPPAADDSLLAAGTPAQHQLPQQPQPLPDAQQRTAQPVTGLRWLRRGEYLLLTWDWPPGSVEAVVHWRSDTGLPDGRGSVRCSKRLYDHHGGFELRVGRDHMRVTVEALGYANPPDTLPSASLRIKPPPAAVSYDPQVRRVWRHWKQWLEKGLVRWTATVRLASDTDLTLPQVLVVLGTGSYRPQSLREGEVVHVIDPRELSAGVPEFISFEVTLPRGTCWLVCLPAMDESAKDDAQQRADLRPASLHRLKVRP